MGTLGPSPAPQEPVDYGRSIDIVRRVCAIAGSLAFLDDIRGDARSAGIREAIAHHETPKLFDWLLTAFSYQGISDQVARNYMDRHGTASWAAISRDIGNEPTCPRLTNYWRFDECKFDKGSMTCSEPELIDACPLPRHRLRNGRLNQTAYCFFLFVRDIANSDLVDWIDHRLAPPAVDVAGEPDPIWKAQERLIGPLRNVYGVSDKILTMALSGLLLGAEEERPAWFEIGAGMIVIDTLVHNFLHRTGILEESGVSHLYGAACYGKGGCAEILRAISGRIDATAFNARFPTTFARFIQHAIWRYCAGDALNICNGNQIDDRQSCANDYCRIGNKCSKKALRSTF